MIVTLSVGTASPSSVLGPVLFRSLLSLCWVQLQVSVCVVFVIASRWFVLLFVDGGITLFFRDWSVVERTVVVVFILNHFGFHFGKCVREVKLQNQRFSVLALIHIITWTIHNKQQ